MARDCRADPAGALRTLIAPGACRRAGLADQILEHREPVGHLRLGSRTIRSRRANAAGAFLGDATSRDEQIKERIQLKPGGAKEVRQPRGRRRERRLIAQLAG